MLSLAVLADARGTVKQAKSHCSVEPFPSHPKNHSEKPNRTESQSLQPRDHRDQVPLMEAMPVPVPPSPPKPEKETVTRAAALGSGVLFRSVQHAGYCTACFGCWGMCFGRIGWLLCTLGTKWHVLRSPRVLACFRVARCSRRCRKFSRSRRRSRQQPAERSAGCWSL